MRDRLWSRNYNLALLPLQPASSNSPVSNPRPDLPLIRRTSYPSTLLILCSFCPLSVHQYSRTIARAGILRDAVSERGEHSEGCLAA